VQDEDVLQRELEDLMLELMEVSSQRKFRGYTFFQLSKDSGSFDDSISTNTALRMTGIAVRCTIRAKFYIGL
jgi:hypothetical protein